MVELFHELGFDTGIGSGGVVSHKARAGNAGYEVDVRVPGAPYICKDPKFFEYCEEVFNQKNMIIEAVIIPLRDSQEIAESRSSVDVRTLSLLGWREKVKFRVKRVFYALMGRRFGAEGGQEGHVFESLQSRVHRGLYSLLRSCLSHEIDVVLLPFPEMLSNPYLLHETLTRQVDVGTLDDFLIVFDSVVELRS
ncbi:hypothetical protein N9X85_05005 [Luminiphilus sp.]|nr:hypothetical protein [Luminiphilus sp.]